MSCNVGGLDRIIRLVVGLVLIVSTLLSAGTSFSWLLMLIGIILIATAAIGFCPLYTALKLNTGCKVKQ
ncbi:MAG: DUF2892 domain-containing protein [Campylobacterales bacterium]